VGHGFFKRFQALRRHAVAIYEIRIVEDVVWKQLAFWNFYLKFFLESEDDVQKVNTFRAEIALQCGSG